MEEIKKDNINSDITTQSLKIDYAKLQSKLQYIKMKRKNKALYLFIYMLSIGVSILFYTIYIYSMNDIYAGHKYKISFTGIITVILISVFLASLISIIINLFYEMKENVIQSDLYEYEVIKMQENLEEDIFDNSLKLSYTYLDKYYHQTREHARYGFWTSVGVAIFGAALIFGGIIAMFCGKVEPSYVTCASGVATEFISSIFFYLYNKTVSSMSRYHNKLVLSQNISFALKVADSLPEAEQTKTKNIIVSELLKDINTNIAKDDRKD